VIEQPGQGLLAPAVCVAGGGLLAGFGAQQADERRVLLGIPDADPELASG
jgi:hypothetical protein